MAYTNLDVESVRNFCENIFIKGYTKRKSADITDVLLTADLCGIESTASSA